MIHLTDFDPVATREDWRATIELTDAETGGPADLSGFVFLLEARRLTPNGAAGVALSGSSAGGEITFPDGPAAGLLDLAFRTPFAGKAGGRYRVVLLATRGAETLLLLSHLNVLDLEGGIA